MSREQLLRSNSNLTTARNLAILSVVAANSGFGYASYARDTDQITESSAIAGAVAWPLNGLGILGVVMCNFYISVNNSRLAAIQPDIETPSNSPSSASINSRTELEKE